MRREALLEVAGAVFSEHGFGGTSLETIAARTGLRKASLLHHFPSKEALYGAALGAVIDDLAGLVREARLDQGDFTERLDRLGELIVRHLGARPPAARLLLREAMDRGPFMRGGGGEAMRVALQAAAEFLAAGMAAGVFVEQDPQQLVLTILGLHFLYFAVDHLTGAFLGSEPLQAAAIDRRVVAVQAHVRRLCLADRVASSDGARRR